jgi:DNA modification methylase
MGGLTDEDAAPELAKDVVTQPGDIWQLGDHRIICGSSTDAATVAALLSGAKPQLMVTDPPYGVDYDPTWRHRAGVSQSQRKGKVRNDTQADWEPAWALFPGNIAYVWHAALHAPTVAGSLVRQGFTIRAEIIWAKDRFVIGRGDYHWQHEPCLYAVRDKGNWLGDRKQTTVWNVQSGNQDSKTVHPTQKPTEIMRRPMQNNSAAGDAIYDPFLGSGTTLIAAETIGRVCLGVELEPKFVDVAIRRWQAFTGKSAVLANDGRTFGSVAQFRHSVAKD